MAAVLTDRRARLQTSPLRHLDVALVLAPVLISGLGLLMIYSATHTRLKDAGADPLSPRAASASSLVALDLAMGALKSRRADLAIAGALAWRRKRSA